MRLPLSWLRDYVDITLAPEELAEQLTLAGLEIERTEYIGIPRPNHAGGELRSQQNAEGRPELSWDRTRVFVGQILEVRPHPNADRLTLAIVDYGRGAPVQVVTGAPNIKVGDRGQKVAFALEGTRLFDGHKPGWELMRLTKSKIRGIESGSMVLSEKELGISADHEGIILLPSDAPVGEPLADYLGDIVFEVKINPNMARCASVVGVAREVAALTRAPLRMPPLQVIAKGPPIKGQAEVVIREKKLNPRFTAALIRGVSIVPSPFWMQRRLTLAGMRPINNIVDVTNYVMIEVGQPLHAFDYDKLYARAGNRPPTILTRLAEPGEVLETLDGVKRKLDPFTILVCDTRGPLSIGGVMGGSESEVGEYSTHILLEAAAWDYINIRRTMQAQHLSSEAGYRFSRGVHPSQAIVGLKRAIELMRQLGGGEIARGVIDAYPSRRKKTTIVLPAGEVKRQLGVPISPQEITQLLQRLDFKVEPIRVKSRKRRAAPRLPRGAFFRVTVPDYRLDVDGTDDLVEEVARLYGYHRIPISRMNDELPPQETNADLEQEERVRDLLVEAGLQEVITYALTTPEHEALLTLPNAYRPALPRHEYVRIENPIAADRTAMRQSLVPSLLDLVGANLRYKSRVALFEVGCAYWSQSKEDVLLPRESASHLPEDKGLPLERRRLAIVLTGSREDVSWVGKERAQMDFFDLKGVVEVLVHGLQLDEGQPPAALSFVASDHPALHPARAATLKIGPQEVGWLGELHPLVRERFDLPAQSVLIGEFDLDAILALAPQRHAVRALSRFPAVVQDLALTVDEHVPADRVTGLIQQTGGDLLQRVVLFDVYRGDAIPRGYKSLAYTLTFQSMDRTLSDEDATKVREKIVNRLKHEIGAELRSDEQPSRS